MYSKKHYPVHTEHLQLRMFIMPNYIIVNMIKSQTDIKLPNFGQLTLRKR